MTVATFGVREPLTERLGGLAALSLERRLCSASWSRSSSFFNSFSLSRCRIPVVMGSSGVA